MQCQWLAVLTSHGSCPCTCSLASLLLAGLFIVAVTTDLAHHAFLVHDLLESSQGLVDRFAFSQFNLKHSIFSLSLRVMLLNRSPGRVPRGQSDGEQSIQSRRASQRQTYGNSTSLWDKVIPLNRAGLQFRLSNGYFRCDRILRSGKDLACYGAIDDSVLAR